MKNNRKYRKAFKHTQSSSLTKYNLVFSKMKKILQESGGELTEDTLTCSVITRCTNINEN